MNNIDNQGSIWDGLPKDYKAVVPQPAQINLQSGKGCLRQTTALDILTKEHKIKVLKELGFTQRSYTVWYHPMMTQDLPSNWINFDPDTDNLVSLFWKIFGKGFREGECKVQDSLKTLLGLK